MIRNQRVQDILKGSGSYDEKVSSLLKLLLAGLSSMCGALSGNTDSYMDEVQGIYYDIRIYIAMNVTI